LSNRYVNNTSTFHAGTSTLREAEMRKSSG
jgi:hypothetical protein